ncbi:MAG: hypothetical protein ABFS10_13790 [Bacteroidota bacterium]
MNRKERLQYCKTCQKKEFDLKKGILCSITHDYADFIGTCPHYVLDESIQQLENYQTDQAELKKEKQEKRQKARTQKKDEKKTRKEKRSDKLRRDDLFLITGMGLITVFSIRLFSYMDYSYTRISNLLSILLVVFITSAISLLLRKKPHRHYRVFGDMKFKLLFSAFVSILNTLYLLVIYSDRLGIKSILNSLAFFLIVSIFLSMLSVSIVIPISLLFHKAPDSDVKTQ